jgi:hypothetical protein
MSCFCTCTAVDFHVLHTPDIQNSSKKKPDSHVGVSELWTALASFALAGWDFLKANLAAEGSQ